jgi:hypothetical protein
MENRIKKTTMLKNKIKRSIIETKEKKEKFLIEQNLVKSRIMMIVKSESNAKNFHRLSEKKQEKMMYSLLEEINYLEEQGMLNEQLWDFLSKIFGKSFGSAVETIAEPLVNTILEKIGLGEYFKNFLISSLTKNPLELSKVLKSCDELTKLIANYLSEAVFMMVQNDKELSGGGHVFLRNALGDAVQDIKFVNSLEKQLSTIVCESYKSMSDKASNVYDKLKTNISDSGGEISFT